jgi:hypothetical protein
MSKKEVNINDSFSKLMHWVFPTYFGVVIERKDGWYYVFGKPHKTWEDATKAVDEYLETLSKSVNRLK